MLLSTCLYHIKLCFTGTQQNAVFLAVPLTLTTILAVTVSVILGVIVYRQKRNSKGRLNISTSDRTANELDTISEYASVPIDLKIALRNEV